MLTPVEKYLSRLLGSCLPLLVLACAAAGLPACFNPNILNGGLRCSEGGLCPEGFVCHPSGRCYKPDTGPADVPPVDMGPCPTTPALCADPPTMGQTCNLACQTGCSCNTRCNVSGAASRCVPLGAKTLGQLCSMGNPSGYDDCAPGLFCLAELESCGNLRRCYRLCSNDSQCKVEDDIHCRIPVLNTSADTGFKACDVPHQECDPVAKNGCPSPAFTCFVLNIGQTVCDCPTNSTNITPPSEVGKEGARCNFYSDCKGGLTCIGLTADGGPQPSTCRQVCVPGKTTCVAGMTCQPLGPKFGFCAP